MKRLKDERGITLIALVVTIVVLIILAGISISVILGENGLVAKAKKAASQTEEAVANDEMGIYMASLRIDKDAGSGQRLADYLSSNIGNDGLEDFLNNGDGHAQVAYKGNKFLVNLDDYTFTYLGKSDGQGVNRHIKQILNNNNEDVPGIAMVEAGEIETEDLGWKVLSVNSDGTVNLIANRNTGFEVSISGINGYTNGVKALNEICSKLYGNLEINGEKVISARSVNLEDFYNVTYKIDRSYTSKLKIQPYINTLDVANDGYSKEQITEYIDVGNISEKQSENTQMLLANTVTIVKIIDKKTEKPSKSMISTGNNYWLATRYSDTFYESQGGSIQYDEKIVNDRYSIYYVSADEKDRTYYQIFDVEGQNNSGINGTYNCTLRPVITVPANSVTNKEVGTEVKIDPFYKEKTGAEAKGYVKADSIASLLGIDIKGINKTDAGLPTRETDMTWSKLEEGGYDSLTGNFDKSKYDYYIADRATKLQIRLTGAEAYNNGVLAIDTICNNLYGNVTEIKLSDGSTKKVKVVLARNAKFEDFVDDSKINNSTYGGIWSTNANDTTATNKITQTQNRYAPTIFTQYENIDKTKGASKGYSDAKIKTYILASNGTSSFLTEEQKGSYSYERYNENPGLKVIYNAYWGNANRNTAKTTTGKEYWLSSRSINSNWHNAHFYLRNIASDGALMDHYVFGSYVYSDTNCSALRPVLQVEK